VNGGVKQSALSTSAFFLKSRIPGFPAGVRDPYIRETVQGKSVLKVIGIPHPAKAPGFGISEKD
jgi:hypothetical protein